MISKKLFDRRMREIKRNNHYISDEQIEFFHVIGMYEDFLRIHKEVIYEFESAVNFHNLIPDEYSHIRLNRFIEIVKEHEKEIFYDCPL